MKHPKLLLGLAFLILLALCCGCRIGEKAVKKYKASAEFPADCADEFPVKIDTAFLQGKTDTVIDYQYYDSTITLTEKGDTVWAVIEVPKTKVVTIRRVDTIFVTKVNTAALEAERRTVKNITEEMIKLDVTIENQAKQIAELKKEKRKWFWFFWAIVAVLGAGVYLRIKRII